MRTIFWNVDTQYDFMRDDEEHKGALAIAGAKSIEDNLAKLTNYAREKSFLTINTCDVHTMEDAEISETPDFKATYPPHCMRGTKGAEFVPATKPLDSYVLDFQSKNEDIDAAIMHNNITVYKNKFDIFSGNQYADGLVDALKPAAAIVYGVATNVCVDQAVTGLLERGVHVYVVQDAIKELPAELAAIPTEETLKAWKEGGAHFVTTHEVTKPGGLGTILDYAAFDLEDHSRQEREQRSYTE